VRLCNGAVISGSLKQGDLGAGGRDIIASNVYVVSAVTFIFSKSDF
jgi:hypothetical protein